MPASPAPTTTIRPTAEPLISSMVRRLDADCFGRAILNSLLDRLALLGRHPIGEQNGFPGVVVEFEQARCNQFTVAISGTATLVVVHHYLACLAGVAHRLPPSCLKLVTVIWRRWFDQTRSRSRRSRPYRETISRIKTPDRI